MLADEVQSLYVALGSVAGKDSISDSEYRGRIATATAIINVDYEDIYHD